ncbi:MAG: MurR/RpiR family transcriptional regulator [Atribacterota bacterium]|jgi:DNA-binding MurR/RpiR family transcriptional regulator|nr:MurR/RpiR family transcriptional regulator [Atribacterota bacterium]MDD3640450.1 MurR/RpiR family transcriptional regulator [Atribacterota bacterium]MDD4288594.1 MurR/RpiR family transcriptional regulator [Atribacterota bacterium]MDI9596085.1 MurR/RpiR family transcriptional regulator [Atribacterota bacterium]
MIKNSTLLQQSIQKKFDELTASQQKIAQYLLKNYEKAAFLTAAKLGKEVGISESTVVRFATVLGYSGYPELQIVLQDMIKEQLTTVNKLKHSINNVYKGKDILYQVLQSDLDNLENTMNEVSPQSFEQLIDLILKSDVIYIVGLRTAASMALFFNQALSLFLRNTKSITYGMEDLFEQIAGINKKDLLIAISFPRYTRRTVEIVEIANKKGAKTAAITDNILSPIAQKSNVSLIARSNLNSFVNSFTAPLSIINAIVTAVSIRKGKQTFKKLSELENMWDMHDVFY